MRLTKLVLIGLASWLFLGQEVGVAETSNSQDGMYAIAIHGGCGSAERLLPEDVQAGYTRSLTAALTLGKKLLQEGGDSLDVVEQVARAMEDDGNFNAGKGSVFTSQGTHELDASIMDGRTMACGAVAGARTVRNPISLARLVMEETNHVLLSGDGVEDFAAQMQVPRVNADYFYTPRLRELWEKYQQEARPEAPKLDLGISRGTIGVVALDTEGNLAAATSTGGMCYKMPGRVGDSPIIGAGTFAKNGVCAISCTGRGEEFIRHSGAKTVAVLMQYGRMSLEDAVEHLIHEEMEPGTGGMIAVGADGAVVMQFSTQAMLRGAADSRGRFDVAIWNSAGPPSLTVSD